MSEVKFTPGPWRYTSSRQGKKYVFSDEGEVVRALSTVGRRKTRPEEKTANAHLIAAAPDMYEALKEAQNALMGIACNRSGDYAAKERAFALIEPAIAKAEGR